MENKREKNADQITLRPEIKPEADDLSKKDLSNQSAMYHGVGVKRKMAVVVFHSYERRSILSAFMNMLFLSFSLTTGRHLDTQAER